MIFWNKYLVPTTSKIYFSLKLINGTAFKDEMATLKAVINHRNTLILLQNSIIFYGIAQCHGKSNEV